MPINPRFKQKDIQKGLDKILLSIERRGVLALAELGERCVIHAKGIPASIGYTDQTGALRASTGYTVYLNGTAVVESFLSTGNESSLALEGLQAGKRLCEEVAENYPKGILLVVVAGMGYSTYLESQGRDVLSSAEQLAEKELPKIINRLRESIKKSYLK